MTAYAWINEKSIVNRGAKKIVQYLKRQVMAEYLEKIYQSLPGCTEAAIAAGGGPRTVAPPPVQYMLHHSKTLAKHKQGFKDFGQNLYT